MKLSNQTNFSVLISNKTCSFLLQICRDFQFSPKFCNQANLRVLISNMTILYLNSSPRNTQIRHFWSRIQAFWLFSEYLQIDRFEGTYFKYDNGLFKVLAKKYLNKPFLFKNTQIKLICSQIWTFFLRAKFAIRQIPSH